MVLQNLKKKIKLKKKNVKILLPNALFLGLMDLRQTEKKILLYIIRNVTKRVKICFQQFEKKNRPNTI